MFNTASPVGCQASLLTFDAFATSRILGEREELSAHVAKISEAIATDGVTGLLLEQLAVCTEVRAHASFCRGNTQSLT